LIAWREGSEEAGGEPKPRPLDLGFSRPLLPWSGNRSIIETAGGWVPAALDRMNTHYLISPGHVPNLKRMPREVIAEGWYFHGHRHSLIAEPSAR
jgi:hypothetical protein